MPAPKHWNSRGPLAVLLLPVAALYALITTVRQFAFHSGMLAVDRVDVPVIIVGNITAGGTGKTPLVLWLAQFLQQYGWRPGIVSRGYGSTRTDPRAVPVSGTPPEYGDEPCLLAQRAGCPVWVGVSRAAVAQALLAAHPEVDVIISDDGLQHYSLARDLEIAVIDGTRGLGNGWPLPAGPLREPESRLAAVDAVVVNGGNATASHPQAFSMHLDGDEFRNLRNPQQVVRAAHFANQRVHAIAGIGNPQRFFDHLQQLGITCATHAYPDHHAYAEGDVLFDDADPVVMTEKDAVKCTAFATGRHWALVVNANIENRLGELIIARLAKARRDG